MRKIDLERNTKETQISLSLNLDGSGESKHKIDLPFFSHMLEQVSKHGDFDISLSASGDLEVDAHHTVEDVGICMGCLLYTSPSPRDRTRSRMPSSA